MVKITPNCFDCVALSKKVSSTGCGTIVSFECDWMGIRMYGNPKLNICNKFRKHKEAEDHD